MRTETEPDTALGRELARSEWSGYLTEFERRLDPGEELETTLELVGPEEPIGTEAERLPLDSVTFEHGDDQIAISLGGRGHRYPVVLRHFVDQPRRMWVHEDDGRPIAITIESEDGTRTLLTLYAQ